MPSDAALRHTLRRTVALLATAACLVGVSPHPAEAARPREERFGTMVNDARERSGKRDIRLIDRLSKVARRHSRRMARSGKLFHSNLNRFLSRRSGRVAENVGMGHGLDSLLDAFLDSPPHARNLLGGWSRTGVGIVRARGRLWVTQIFRS